jgi:hypothetical protein
MSGKLEHFGFNLYENFSLKYIIHYSFGWDRISWVYYPRVNQTQKSLPNKNLQTTIKNSFFYRFGLVWDMRFLTSRVEKLPT